MSIFGSMAYCTSTPLFLRRAFVRVLATVLLVTGIGVVSAAEQIGPVHPIAEPDMLDAIQAKLAEKERTGEVAKLQKQFEERVKRHAETPDPVAGLSRTTKARTFYWDPSVRAPKTITTPDGRVIVRAGEMANPLDYVSLSNHLLFFDARDPEQVAKAVALIEHYDGRVKPILTGGPVIELMRTWKKRVYFDQGGALTRRFAIRHVPALVSQEGKRLRIDELKL